MAPAAGKLAARASLAAGTALTASALTGSSCQMLPTHRNIWSLAGRTAGAGRTELLGAFSRDGFIRVELSRAELSTLEEAVGEFGQARAFRYPPPPPDPDAYPTSALDVPAAPTRMAPPFGRCFNTLYGILVAAAHSLLGTEHVAVPTPPCVGDALPFEGPGGPWPYGASFFNIFNYDHGCLNTHRDRGVLTAVYGVGGEPDVHAARPQSAASRLWLRAKGPEGARWVAPESRQLLLWAGDGLEVSGVEPVEHCVRVDPEGPYIERSHSRSDPAAPPSGNRRSVALVLDE